MPPTEREKTTMAIMQIMELLVWLEGPRSSGVRCFFPPRGHANTHITDGLVQGIPMPVAVLRAIDYLYVLFPPTLWPHKTPVGAR